MSFFTTFDFYRPTPPPRIDGLDLARFLKAFAGLGVSTDLSLPSKVRFGHSIDQDEKPSHWVENHGLIGRMCGIEWDVIEKPESLEALAALLATHRKPVYRADLYLGGVAPHLFPFIHRQPSAENDRALTPFDWWLTLGPIETSDLGADDSFLVGWMSVGLGGDGYLYPWTFRDWIASAERSPEIRAVQQLCRTLWPVDPSPPRRKVVRGRKRMGKLWPYDRLDPPQDWFWGIDETG